MADNIKEQLNDIKSLQAAVKQTSRDLEDLGKRTDDNKDKFDQLTKQLREQRDALDKLTKEINRYNKGLDETASALGQVVPGIDKLTDAAKKNEDGLVNLATVVESTSRTFISGMMAMAATIEETNVALAKQTGFATALQQDIIDLASSHDDLFLSLSDSAKIVGALSTGFKMYNAQSKETRRQVNDLAGRFQVLGVDASATAAVIDQLNEGFGLTTAGAIAAAAELENLAIRTGMPLSSVVSDFQDLAPQMARFGSDGTRVFSRLSEQARTLGLTVRQIFDLAELVDTFEGAADVAGKLNAQLGLQLNSIELMGASREDVLKIMRAEFEMEGLRFDQMSRRQRQMVAEILQTDAMTASRLLGDPMELRKFQKEEEDRDERLKKFTTSMDKFSAVAEQLFINLSPLLTGVLSVFNTIAEVINGIVSSGFGELISKALAFGSVVATVARITTKAFSAVASTLAQALAPLLFLYDLYKAVTGDEAESAAAKTRIAAGIGGAAIGGLAGGVVNPLGYAIGYGLGREAPALVNSAVAGDLSASPGKVRSVTTMGGTRYNISPEDGVRVSPNVGGLEDKSLSEVSSKLDNLSKAVMELAKRPVQATMEMNGNKVGELVLNQMDPVATV